MHHTGKLPRAGGRLCAGLAILVMVAGCGGMLRGDPDGLPTTVRVQLTRAWVESVSERVIVVGPGPGAEDGREAGFGFGDGVYQTTTEVELVARHRPGGRLLVRYPLSWGSNRFAVPLRPGEVVHWAVVISGGRSAALAVGETTVRDGFEVIIDLSGRPATVSLESDSGAAFGED